MPELFLPSSQRLALSRRFRRRPSGAAASIDPLSEISKSSIAARIREVASNAIATSCGFVEIRASTSAEIQSQKVSMKRSRGSSEGIANAA